MRLCFILIALLGLFSGCYEDNSREKSTTPAPTVAPAVLETAIPGGYIKQDPASEDTKKMAQKAVELLQKDMPGVDLHAIVAAATQVVAGVNYYFRLELKTTKKVSSWDIIVFQGLDKSLTLVQKEEVK